MRAHARFRADPFAAIDALRRRGDIAHTRFGRSEFFLLSHPEEIRHVLATDAASYALHSFVYWRPFRRPRPAPPMRGLINQHDPNAHRGTRRAYALPFSSAAMDAVWPDLYESTARAVERWAAHEQIDAVQELRVLVAEQLPRACFGAPLPIGPEETAEVFYRSYDNPFYMASRVANAVQSARLPTRVRQARAYLRLVEATQALIDERRAGGGGGHDFLSTMLELVDRGEISEEQARYEALGMLYAGMDVTMFQLMWMVYELARRPGWVERIRAEAEALTPERPPSRDESRFTQAFIHESLRLHAILTITRQAIAPTAVAGHRIRPGDYVWISPYFVHRDERWYRNAEAFRPERWLDGSLKGNSPFVFIPFSRGPHMCANTEFPARVFSVVLPLLCRSLRPALPVGFDVTLDPLFRRTQLTELPLLTRS